MIGDTTSASQYYQSRFSHAPERVGVWRMICERLQGFMPPTACVLDLGAGYCSFINPVRPDDLVIASPTPAWLLIARVNAALVTQAYTPLLQFQGSINQRLRRLPVEPVLTQLSVIQFVCVMMIIYEMFHIARSGLDTLLGRLLGDDEAAVGDAVI